jgi:hypothetical protein
VFYLAKDGNILRSQTWKIQKSDGRALWIFHGLSVVTVLTVVESTTCCQHSVGRCFLQFVYLCRRVHRVFIANHINQLLYLMETKGTAWAVRTEFLNIIYMEFIPSRFWTVGSLHVYLCLVHRYFKLTYQPSSLHKPKVFSSHQESE